MRERERDECVMRERKTKTTMNVFVYGDIL